MAVRWTESFGYVQGRPKLNIKYMIVTESVSCHPSSCTINCAMWTLLCIDSCWYSCLHNEGCKLFLLPVLLFIVKNVNYTKHIKVYQAENQGMDKYSRITSFCCLSQTNTWIMFNCNVTGPCEPAIMLNVHPSHVVQQCRAVRVCKMLWPLYSTSLCVRLL